MLYVSWLLNYLFFFKQKTAYEMRISDWSSDVCSSDLVTSKSQQRNGAAETADHFGRHRAEASVQHRIGRPSQRAGGGGEVAEGVARVEGKRAALGDQDGGAGKDPGGAGEMAPAQPLARQPPRTDTQYPRHEVGGERTGEA